MSDFIARVIAELDTTKLQSQLNGLKNQKIKIDVGVDGGNSIANIGNAAKQSSQSVDGLGSSIRDVTKNTLAATAAHKAFNATVKQLNDAVGEVKKLNDALTTVHMTMQDLSKSDLNILKSQITGMANDLSTYTKTVSDAVEIYANANESIETIMKKAEPTVLLATASGKSASDASNTVQGILNQFHLADDAAMGVVDTLEGLSAEMNMDFAKGIQNVSEAIAVSGSVIDTAGMSFEKYASIVSATAESTRQSGSTLGNAFKTIASRIGRSMDGETTDAEKSKAEEAFNSVGVSVRNANGDIRDLSGTLDDLSEIWGSLNRAQQNYVAEQAAGVRQINIFKSMMDTYSRSAELEEKALNSSGMALKVNETRAESIDGKLQKVSASLTEMYSNAVSEDAIMGMLDFADSIIAVADNLNLLQGVFAAMGAAGLANGVMAIAKNWQSIVGIFTNPVTIVAAGIGAAVSLYSTLKQKQEELIQSTKEASDAWAENNDAILNHVDRITELRTQLDSGTLSEMDAYQAKQELLSIQQQLTESYGQQAAGIDLLNGKLDDQISKVTALTAAEANQFLNENRKGIAKAEKEMTKTLGGDESWWKEAGEVLGVFWDDGSDATKKIKDIAGKYSDYLKSDDMGDGSFRIRFVGDATEAKTVLNDVMTDIRSAEKELGEDNGVLNSFFEGSGSVLQDANEILDEYQDIYKQAQEARLIADESLFSFDGQEQTASKWLNDYAAAIEKYNNALLTGDTSKITQARNEFDAIDTAVQSLLQNDGMSQYADQFNDVKNQLNSTAAANAEFIEQVNGNTTEEASKSVHEYAESLKKLGMTDTQFKDAFFFDPDNAKDGTEAVKNLVKAAQDIGLISAEPTEAEIASLADTFVSNGTLIADTSNMISDSVSSSFDDIQSKSSSVVSGIKDIQSVFSEQSAGKSVSLDFEDANIKSYASALEYVNGTMQLNAEKVKEIAQAKADEQLAINNTNKALEQAQYLKNAREIEQLRATLADASDSEKQSIQANIDSLLEENNAIADTCKQYDLLSASIQEAISSYSNWLNAQSASDYGDMADDAVSAISQIRDTFDSNSDIFGNFGSKKFDAAVDFIVPDSVDKDDLGAIESYMSDFKQYLSFDKDGKADGLNVDKFLTNAVEAGLMSYSDDDGFQVLGGKKMEDFAEGLNMSSGMVQAFFDELQLKGADFDWGDEAVKTIGDLAVEANQAAESLRSMDGNSDLKIKMDVSDLATTEEQISALDATIAEMDGIKAKPDVDASSIDNANAVIQYCLTQKQLLSQPDVMRVDTSQIQGEISNAISLLQQFQTAQNELEIKQKVGADTSDAEAKVQSLATEIQGLSPDIKAKLEVDTTSIDSIQTSISGLSAETLNVKVGVDASAIEGYNPDTKNCEVIYNPETSLLPESFDDINRTVNYMPVTSSLPSSFSTITRYVNYVKTGDVSVNGTAHASGTAKAGGDWGTAPGGRTLVGELGQEIVVDPYTGKWYTVGDNGAEFRDIPAGAIVFNHVQSKALLENGYVSGRASALVSGTAMVTGGYKPYKPSVSSSSSKSSSTSSSSGKKSSGNDSSSKSSTSKSKSDDKIDYIAIAIDRAERAINKLKKVADSVFKSFSNRNKKLAKEINKVTSEIELQKKGYDRYLKEANSVGLSSDIKKKIQSGSIDITKYNEDTKKKISEYQEWYEKALDCKDAIDDLNESLSELILSRLVDTFFSKISLTMPPIPKPHNTCCVLT